MPTMHGHRAAAAQQRGESPRTSQEKSYMPGVLVGEDAKLMCAFGQGRKAHLACFLNTAPLRCRVNFTSCATIWLRVSS